MLLVVHVVFLFLFLLLSTRSQIVSKSETLTPTNSNSNGAKLISHFSEVSIIDNEWNVAVQSQNSWQFIIIMDSSWGFDPFTFSSIKFTINSVTTGSGSILFGLTANNEEYLSMSIPSNDDTNLIYPNCDASANPTQSYANGDIASIPDFDRNCDIAGGLCSNWKDMLPTTTESNQFPLSFILENAPASNTMVIRADTTTSTAYLQSCGFVQFPTNRGLKIYIAGDDPGQTFKISSFLIESFAESLPPTSSPTTTAPTTLPPTHLPTVSPTNDPTISPSNDPTPAPTNAPNNDPTRAPSTAPSISPTNTPTSEPSLSPTNAPSNDPTPAPSTAPSISPTNTPTAPSILPSVAPSNAPTAPPTAAPTTSPLFAPTNAPTSSPSLAPTNRPTMAPSPAPTQIPTADPTRDPTTDPTKHPTLDPTNDPTKDPTMLPTINPTKEPTNPTCEPTAAPTMSPTDDPTVAPTIKTTTNPTANPSTNPTANPSTNPTTNPSTNPTTLVSTESNTSDDMVYTANSNSFIREYGVIIIICVSCTIVIALLNGICWYHKKRIQKVKLSEENPMLDAIQQEENAGNAMIEVMEGKPANCYTVTVHYIGRVLHYHLPADTGGIDHWDDDTYQSLLRQVSNNLHLYQGFTLGEEVDGVKINIDDIDDIIAAFESNGGKRQIHLFVETSYRAMVYNLDAPTSDSDTSVDKRTIK